MPAAPGRYRLTVTLHDDDGVAFDAATQATFPSLIVRVTGDLDASSWPWADREAVGAEITIGSGSATWARPVGHRGHRSRSGTFAAGRATSRSRRTWVASVDAPTEAMAGRRSHPTPS